MASSTATQSLRQILERYWGLIVLLAWGGALLSLDLLRTTPYGLDEGAARGLLLIWSISDKIINPIVTLGIPDFRALLFIPLGAWWNGAHRRSQRAFSGWFFMQLLWVGITITLHPAGLAYPLILAWAWHKDPLDPRRKRQLWMGLVLVTAVTLAKRGGWTTIEWGITPLLRLAQAHQSVIGVAEPNWLIGGHYAALQALGVRIARRFLTSGILGLLLFAE